MESKEFNIKGEGIFENAFTLDVNKVLHKYQYKIIVFLTRPAKTSTESGSGTGMRRREGPSRPGEEDAAKWDRMEPL